MKIFEFNDYKSFVLARVKSQPKGGRGEFLRIAQHANLHTTTVSQIFRGDKQLTLEQACSVCDYFGLNDLETSYFLLLLQLERAGTERLRKALRIQLDQVRAQSVELSKRLKQDKALTNEERAVFYSNWYYSGIRVLSSIPGHQGIDSIASYFGLPKRLVNDVVEFLVSAGLCIEEGGRIQPAAKYTHLESGSPHIARHHSNWRVKAMERFPALSPQELAYTSPMSLSEVDAVRVRDLLMELVEKVNAIRGPSECEKLMCLNLDWFEF